MSNIVCLFIKSGPLRGHKYFVKTDAPILIGRGDNANIKITEDNFCSRKHAVIFWENDACFIQDLDSTNGTRLNKSRIEGRSKLNDCDVINLGSTEVVVAITKQLKQK